MAESKPLICGGENIEGDKRNDCFVIGESEPVAMMSWAFEEASSILLDDGRLWVTGLFVQYLFIITERSST